MTDLLRVRIDLLGLTYAHGRSAEEAVERAKVLEAYVLPMCGVSSPEATRTTEVVKPRRGRPPRPRDTQEN